MKICSEWTTPSERTSPRSAFGLKSSNNPCKADAFLCTRGRVVEVGSPSFGPGGGGVSSVAMTIRSPGRSGDGGHTTAKPEHVLFGFQPALRRIDPVAPDLVGSLRGAYFFRLSIGSSSVWSSASTKTKAGRTNIEILVSGVPGGPSSGEREEERCCHRGPRFSRPCLLNGSFDSSQSGARENFDETWYLRVSL